MVEPQKLTYQCKQGTIVCMAKINIDNLFNLTSMNGCKVEVAQKSQVEKLHSKKFYKLSKIFIQCQSYLGLMKEEKLK